MSDPREALVPSIPTTGEIRYRVEHGWEPYGDGSFDRWLAQHDAEVKAEALREAAEQLEAHGRFDVPVWTLLRDRADSIEGGGDRG